MSIREDRLTPLMKIKLHTINGLFVVLRKLENDDVLDHVENDVERKEGKKLRHAVQLLSDLRYCYPLKGG